LYDSQGNYTKALEYHEKSLEIGLKTLGEDHPDVATSYNNIGLYFYNQSNYIKSKEYLEKSLEILLKVFNEYHYHGSITYSNLGRVYFCQGYFNKTIECHEKYLISTLNTIGEENMSCILRGYLYSIRLGKDVVVIEELILQFFQCNIMI
jgi:tetratricopeptide (TPR) repeat protein